MNSDGYSRRSFIKMTGLAIGAVLMAPVASSLPSSVAGPIQADVFGKKYLGTRNGLLFESTDSGKTWQKVANFGAHCAVAGLREHQGHIVADIAVAGHGFALTSADARLWRTV
jgi:hypothetical protein